MVVLQCRNYGMLQVILTVLLTFLVTSGAWAATLTGSVQNNSGKAGRVYVRTSSNNYGTSFTITAGQTLPFSIRGITDSGHYTVEAFLDVTKDGVRHANEPAGISSPVQISGETVNVGTITLTNPSVPFSEIPDYSPLVTPLAADGGVFLMLDGGFLYFEDANEEFAVAETFTVERATNGSANPAVCSSLTNITTVASAIKNRDQGAWADKNGQANNCYRVTAHATGQTSVTSDWMPVMPKSGIRSVSGAITINGVTPSGPLYVALVDETSDPPKVAAAGYASPTSPQSFTITGVEDGTYFLYAFVDMNNNGIEDFGDVSVGEENITSIVVSGQNVSGATAAMDARDSIDSITTSHWNGIHQWGYFDNYSLNFTVDGMRKKPVTVVVTSGTGLTTPVDVGSDDWGFSTWVYIGSTRPVAGGQYSLDITYEDDNGALTTKAVAVTVTAVLDAFANNLSPTGNVILNPNQPFTWTAPSAPPGYYYYSVHINDATNYNQIWNTEDLPSTATSVTYNQDGQAFGPLEGGKTYQYSISVTDIHGNSAFRQTIFTPASGPAINGFTPAGGSTGNTVYIDGLNFSATPANNVVTFNGTNGRVAATVTAATATRLTVTVPAGVSDGSIQVTTDGVGPAESASDFSVGTAGSFSGLVVNSASVPQGSVTVSLADNSSVKATSQEGTGAFALNGLPATSFYTLIAEKAGFLPAVSSTLSGGMAITATVPFCLFTPSEVQGWGVYAGKGVIAARVLDQNGDPVGDAVASITSGMGKTYSAVYSSDGITPGGASTSANNGLIIIPNVEPGDMVTLRVNKTGWTFSDNFFQVRPFAVSEGMVSGFPETPFISNISPTSGKAGSTVVITGSNLGTTQAVTLAGQAALFVVNSDSQLTVTVPAGASSGEIMVDTFGGVAASAYFTVLQTLEVATAGSGSGTVTSTSPDSSIACQSGSSANCTADFNKGTPVTLTATPDGSGSVFSGWSGACTASEGDCNVTMNSDNSVTATFSVTPNLKVINAAVETTFASFMDAYTAAATGNTIKARAMDFTGPFNLNRAISVVLSGGYDSAFQPTSGYTRLLNGLTISLGAVTVSGVIIQ
uniref:Transcription factor n=1 Tax=Geobacter metallireducens TaxID=28232 RepID=A0A831XFT7_GEOME